MVKKRVTLFVESEVYDKFKEHCDKQGLVLSKRFERFMEEELKRIKNKSSNG